MRKLTLKDSSQIITSEHQEDMDAKRVFVVNELPVIKLPEVKLPEIKMPSLEWPKEIEKQVIVKDTSIERIEVPVIIKEIEIKEIEKPIITIQKELQIERVEIPVVQKEVQMIEIPIVIKEYKDLPKWINAVIIIQAVLSLAILLKR